MDGQAWSGLGSGVDGQVTALATCNGRLYAAGGFTTAGGLAASGIACWNQMCWSAMQPGIPIEPMGLPDVRALGMRGRDIYVGGSFLVAGGGVSSRIVRYDWPDRCLCLLNHPLFEWDSFTPAVRAVIDGATWFDLLDPWRDSLFYAVPAFSQ